MDGIPIAKLLTTHFNHNGYQEYPDEVTEKTNEEIIGIKDVIHSVGALLSIIQTFPKLSNSFEKDYIDKQNYGDKSHQQDDWLPVHTKVITNVEIIDQNNQTSFVFPDSGENIFEIENSNTKGKLFLKCICWHS